MFGQVWSNLIKFGQVLSSLVNFGKNIKNRQKICFKKYFFWHLPKMLARIQNHIWIDFCPRIPKLVLKIVLHKQMTEQLSFEVDVRNGQKSEKNALF